MSLQSMGSGRIDSGFGSDTSISSSTGGFGGGSSFGLSTEVESFSKPKGLPLKLLQLRIIWTQRTKLDHHDAVTSF